MANTRFQLPIQAELLDALGGGFRAISECLLAFGYKANPLGVCLGMTNSASDAFLAGDLIQFFQTYYAIKMVYENCKVAITAEFTANASLNDQDALNHAAQQLEQYAVDPVKSELVRKIRHSFASSLDVISRGKEEVIKEAIEALRQSRSEKVRLRYLEFKKSLESVLAVPNPAQRNHMLEIMQKELCKSSRMKALITARWKQKLADIPKENINFLNQCQAFFTRISLYQSIKEYKPHFEGNLSFPFVSPRETEVVVAPLVESKSLEAAGGQKKIYAFSGCYNYEELKFYFASLKRAFTGWQQRLSLKLENRVHTLFLGFDAVNQSFVFFDYNYLPIITRDEARVAEQVMVTYARNLIAEDIFQSIKNYKATDVLGLDQALLGPLLERAKKKKHGPEALSKAFVVMGTKISALVNSDNPLLAAKLKQWHDETLAVMHEPTREKIKKEDPYFTSWLYMATVNGDLGALRKILAFDVKVEEVMVVGVMTNNLEVVRLLLPRLKVHPDETKKTGATPLMAAVDQNIDPEIVRLLLQYGSNPNFVCDSGFTPAQVAQTRKNTAALALFKEHQESEQDAKLKEKRKWEASTPQPQLSPADTRDAKAEVYFRAISLRLSFYIEQLALLAFSGQGQAAELKGKLEELAAIINDITLSPAQRVQGIENIDAAFGGLPMIVAGEVKESPLSSSLTLFSRGISDVFQAYQSDKNQIAEQLDELRASLELPAKRRKEKH